VGLLPVVVTLTICNIGVGRTQVDDGAGLNLLSPEVFPRMQIVECKLTPSVPFYGVTNVNTLPLGRVELPVTFYGWDKFRTKKIMFDMAHFDLSYNAILRRPALAKLMWRNHPKYWARVH
jgi:hypothetical protein